MPIGGNAGAIVIERAERALVVRASDADTKAIGFAAALPSEPSRTTVVVDASAAGALNALDDRLLEQLKSRLYADAPPGWGMRLVAARAGRPDPSGAPPLAARLADRLGVGVVAPDGELIALRGGELFSAGPGAGWLGFRRGGIPEWTGPRYPAPVWQAALPREFRSAKPRPFSRFRSRERRAATVPVTVTAIPAGLWVRGAGTAPLPLVDLGFGVPVEPGRPLVLVGAPGERVPGVGELVAFYESLPPVVRENAVLVPYGQSPSTCAALAQGLADRLDITIRAYHALPHYATDGTCRFAIFNTTGAPESLTRTPESVYAPARATSTARSHTGVREPALAEAAQGTLSRGPVSRGPVSGGAVMDRPVAGGPVVGEPDAGGPDFGGSDVGGPDVGGPVAGRVPESRFTAPDTGDAADDFDPVVFEASIDTPTQPIAPLDGSAFAAPAEQPPGQGAVVLVDAGGVLRPAGRWSITPITIPGAFAPEAAPAAAALEFMSEGMPGAAGTATGAGPAVLVPGTGPTAMPGTTLAGTAAEAGPEAFTAGPLASETAWGNAAAGGAPETGPGPEAAPRAAAAGMMTESGPPLMPEAGPVSGTTPGAVAGRAVTESGPLFAPEAGPASETTPGTVAGRAVTESGPATSAARRPAEAAPADARTDEAAETGETAGPEASPARGDVPAAFAAEGDGPPGSARPVTDAPTAPSAFQTTVSTVFPQTRPTARAVPMRSRPPEPGTPHAATPPAGTSGEFAATPGEPAHRAPQEPRQEAASEVPDEVRATPDQVVWDPRDHDTQPERRAQSPAEPAESAQNPAPDGTTPRDDTRWAPPIPETRPSGSSRGAASETTGSWSPPTLEPAPAADGWAAESAEHPSWAPPPVAGTSSQDQPHATDRRPDSADPGSWPSPSPENASRDEGAAPPSGEARIPENVVGSWPSPLAGGAPRDGAVPPSSGETEVSESSVGSWPSPQSAEFRQAGAAPENAPRDGAAAPPPGEARAPENEGAPGDGVVPPGEAGNAGGSWPPPEAGTRRSDASPGGADPASWPSPSAEGTREPAAPRPGTSRADAGSPPGRMRAEPLRSPSPSTPAETPENPGRSAWAPPQDGGQGAVRRSGEAPGPRQPAMPPQSPPAGSWVQPVDPQAPGANTWAPPQTGGQPGAVRRSGEAPGPRQRAMPPQSPPAGSWVRPVDPQAPGASAWGPPQDAGLRAATPRSDETSAGPHHHRMRPGSPVAGSWAPPQNDGDRPPAHEPVLPPVPPALPQDYDRLWLADRMSTPEERQAFRASLGWRYDAAARSVARLLAEHPGLRGAQTDEALMTELAAVRVFVGRSETELVETIRSGGGEHDAALAVCAAAGLRRLPSFQGVVVRGGPVDPAAADAYRPGQDLIEAAPLIALDDIDAPVPGKVEIIIWSATARRLNGFVEKRTTPEVVFLPGTVFRVLSVGPPFAPGAPGARRVLLTEVPAAKAGPGHDDWTARITARLEEAVANRAAPSGEFDEPDDRFSPLPGDPARSMP